MYGDYRISNVPADMDGVSCVTNEGKQKGVCLQSICTVTTAPHERLSSVIAY